MVSRFFLLSAFAFFAVAAQSLTESLLDAPDIVARIALLPDEAFKFDFANAPATARSVGAGGFSASANAVSMPATIGNDVSITIGFLGPCGSNTPHTHPRSAEFNFVTNGTLITAMIPENGAKFVYNEVKTNQATLFPEGAIHFEFNPDCTPVTFFAFFSDSFPGVNQIAQRFFGLPDDIVAAALGIDVSEVDKISSLIPDNIALAIQECTKRCGISRGNQPTKQQQKNVPPGPSSSTSNSSNNSTTPPNTSSGVKSDLEGGEGGNNKGLIIGLIAAVGVMALGYIVLAVLALLRRRKGGKGTARGYVKTGETFAPGGVYDSEKYELPSERLRTPYDPPSGSH